MVKYEVLLLLLIGIENISFSNAFWSLDSDLQLGYAIRDHTYEINSILMAISSVASRSNIVQNDDKTKKALASLNVLSSNVRGSPTTFYNEIGFAAASRVNTEIWHFNRIKNSFLSYDSTLKNLLETSSLQGLSEVSNSETFSKLNGSLNIIRNLSNYLLIEAQNVTLDIARLRANRSVSSLTPDSISNAISVQTQGGILKLLIETREIFREILLNIEDIASLTGSHGSIHEILSRSATKDTTSRNNALQNFINNFNRVKNNLLSSIANYRQNAETGIYNFIRKVQSTYDENIVRPNFDQNQLPIILSFAKVISSNVYNQTFFETEFDKMKNSIVESFTDIVNGTLSDGSEYRDKILDLQKNYYVRSYSSCIDELVSEAQQSSNSISNRYTFCLQERTSGIVVVIPSASIWLGSIRDSINTALQQLNFCFSGQTSVDGRTATSTCFQYNVNNLPFYASYLPIVVQANLRPVVESSPAIFQNCINTIQTDSIAIKFDEIYKRCHPSEQTTTTTTTTTKSTTPVESSTITPDSDDDASGNFDELSHSYFLVEN